MWRTILGLALVALCVEIGAADSIWQRRNPNFCYFYKDTRARRIGDLLTIEVREVTLFDGKEDRKMNKDTKTNATLSSSGSWQDGAGSHSFSGNLTGAAVSQRQLNGKADYKSDRTFTDRMSVVVTEVLPNGNLVIEGYRRRRVVNEEKVLRVTGLVRPQDVGANNVVQSQYIANFEVSYLGRGPETSYTNNGWMGKVFNWLWPF